MGGEHHLRMPLHPQQPRVAGQFDTFNEAVTSSGDRYQSIPELLDALMMERVDCDAR